MSFCEHCEGQRFDRARTLRLIRRHLRACPPHTEGREALSRAIEEIRSLDIPHLELLDDTVEGEVIH
jgi:hypothetical protein